MSIDSINGFWHPEFAKQHHVHSQKVSNWIMNFLSKDKEAILRLPQGITKAQVAELLTNIKNDAIMNSEDINYRLSLLTYDNKKLDTKIDYWISSIQSIGSLILRYNLTVVN
jgi:hypothetical protein